MTKTKCYKYPGIVAYPCKCGFFGIPKTFVDAEAVCANCADAQKLNPQPLQKSKTEYQIRQRNRAPKTNDSNVQREKLILKYLEDGPRRSEEIRTALMICRTTSNLALSRLYHAGKILKSEEHRRSHKIWALPEHADLLEEYTLGKQLATRFLKTLRMGTVTTSSLSNSLRIPDFEVDAIGDYLLGKGRVEAIALGNERFYSLRKNDAG